MNGGEPEEAGPVFGVGLGDTEFLAYARAELDGGC
jgi:hypothetical protein